MKLFNTWVLISVKMFYVVYKNIGLLLDTVRNNWWQIIPH